MQLAEKLRKNFAQNLWRLRTERALTQAGLVDALNKKYNIQLKRTSVANYEAREAMPKIDALYCIADFFDQTIDQMIGPAKEKPIPMHPWELPESRAAEEVPGPSEEFPAAAEKPVLPESRRVLFDKIINLDALISENAKNIAYQRFYVNLFRNLLKQMQENVAQLDEPEKIKRFFSRIYVDELLSRSKFFQDRLKIILEEQEYKVFQGLHGGSTVNMLSDALQLPEEEVLKTFQSAKIKILEDIDRTQNE